MAGKASDTGFFRLFHLSHSHGYSILLLFGRQVRCALQHIERIHTADPVGEGMATGSSPPPSPIPTHTSFS